MTRFLMILPLLFVVAACRDEVTQNTDPVALNAEALDYYCQMNVIEHSGPKAQVHLEGLPQAPRFFAQVRDAVAFARMPEQDHVILAIWVSDMGAASATWNDPGAANWIDARQAVYVIGSSRQGGMGGPELVPFARAEDAAAFAARYGGSLSGFDAIPDSAIGEAGAEGTDDLDKRLRALDAKGA